jgi:hypothetical protein
MLRHRFCIGCTILAAALAAAAARGQSEPPWDIYQDAASASLCGVINAENAELVVVRATGELRIISGVDVTIPGSFVADNGDVFIGEDLFGLIAYAADADDLRTIWWLDNTGINVVRINAFTNVPEATNKRPDSFADVACDPCDFWDLAEPACEIETAIVTQPRGGQVCAGRDFVLNVQAIGSRLDGYQWLKNGEPIPGATSATLQLRSVTLDDTATYRVQVFDTDEAVIQSNAATVVVAECSSPIMCGSNAAASMALSLAGLASVRTIRRRRTDLSR